MGGRVDRVAHGSSPAFAVVRKHLHRHGVLEAPDHADRPFALVTDQVRRAEAGKRQGHCVAFFLATGKHQHRIPLFPVMQEILAIGVVPGGAGAYEKGKRFQVDMGAKQRSVDGRAVDHNHGKGQGTFLEERPQPVADRLVSDAVEHQAKIGQHRTTALAPNTVTRAMWSPAVARISRDI